MARSIFTPLTINAGGSTITSDSAANIPLVLKAAVSQSANLQEWQNSAGTVLASINSAGLPTFTRQLAITQSNSGETPLRITGASGQSVDLQQWRNSSTTVLAKIDQNGFLVAGGATVLSNAVISSSIYGTTQVGIVVRGTAGQTANLQEWQTSTPTTVAYIGSGGAFRAEILQSNSANFDARTANGGGQITMLRQTATASNPGANYARLYLRDGTTAGTLKFVTITGASGVEETIVDNLSSTGSTASAQFVGAGGVDTAGSLKTTTGLNLSGAAATVTLNGSVGTSGQVLTSAGAGATPTWTTVSASFTGGTLTGNLTLAAGTTSLSPLTFQSGTNLTTVTSGVREYDGTVFYSTSNTNPGRALDTQSYYYASNGSWAPDFTASTTAQSFLGGVSTGITLAAGTTYEFEFYTTTRFQIIGTANAASGAYQITVASGTATVGVSQIIEYGNNTTGMTTATTLSAIQTSTNSSVTFSPSTSSGSRYSILRAKGVIRVTGSGTAKIYPSLTPSALMTTSDPNYSIWTVNMALFKLIPIGNGTATTVGTWA